jgi:hypothetical protein
MASEASTHAALMRFKKEDLQEVLRDQDIDVEGTKEELIQRILDSREAAVQDVPARRCEAQSARTAQNNASAKTPADDLDAEIAAAEKRLRLAQLNKQLRDLEAGSQQTHLPSLQHTQQRQPHTQQQQQPGQPQQSSDPLPGEWPATDVLSFLQAPRPEIGQRSSVHVSDFLNPQSKHDAALSSMKRILQAAASEGREPRIPSLAQWIVGNARVLMQMLREGRLLRTDTDGHVVIDDLLGYLRFNEQIGELLCQGHNSTRVMAYDADYRRQVAVGDNEAGEKLRWGEPSFFLASKHLMAPAQSTKSERQQMKVTAPTTAQGQAICLNYNSSKGCARQPCRYAHACKICLEAHSARDHPAKN